MTTNGKRHEGGFPMVTLAVPTLNRLDRLQETLRTVRAQDYVNLEILVSDNGSRNDAAAALAAIAASDSRVRVRRNEATVASHEHFTQCLNEARGEFFILLCDDDLISPRFVTELVDVARRNPDVAAVVPANAVIDENGTVTKALGLPESDFYEGAEFVCRYWLYWTSPQVLANVVTFLGKTEILRRFGGYRPFERGQNMDNLLFLQCAISGRVGFARHAVFYWRVYTDSYGFTATAKQIAVSSRQFVNYVRHDAATAQALSELPIKRQQEIIRGVRLITMGEFLSRVGFSQSPFRWSSIRELAHFHWDGLFGYVVLRHLCYTIYLMARGRGRGR